MGICIHMEDSQMLTPPAAKNKYIAFHLRKVDLFNQQKAIGVGRTSQFPLPPNRTGGFPAYGSPVGGLTSKRVDAHEHEPHLRRTSLAPRRKHWASDCDPNHGLAPYALLAGAGGCAIAFVSNCPRRKRCDAGYV